MPILVFNDINASHAGTGYHGRTDLPDFHIFTIEDTYPSTRHVMPPYRFNFYQIVYFVQATDASLNVNAQTIDDLSNGIFFASPEHVLSWVRGEAQRGFILYFKSAFLAHYPRLIADEFPFFRLDAVNNVEVTSADKQTCHDHFVRLLHMFNAEHPYRVQMLQAYLMALLFDCKRLFDRHEAQLDQSPPQHVLVYRFQHLINQHFVTRKRVSDYADLLAVSPDYLGQVVKEVTGKTPLTHIADRIVLEAKKLLLFSELKVGEVGAYLGYEEPTHFGRFFRKHVAMSPLTWRQQNA